MVLNARKEAGDRKVPRELLTTPIGNLTPQTVSSKKFLAIEKDRPLAEAVKALVDNNLPRIAVGSGKAGETAPLYGIITGSRVLRVLLASEDPSKAGLFGLTLRHAGFVGKNEALDANSQKKHHSHLSLRKSRAFFSVQRYSSRRCI